MWLSAMKFESVNDLVDDPVLGTYRHADEVQVGTTSRRHLGPVRVVVTGERVRALRQRGVLAGVHYTVDLAELGRPVQAMITVRLRPQSRQVVHGFRDFVLELSETLQVFVTTGTEDLLVHVAVASTEALRDFVLDSLTKRREVAGVRTEVVFDHLRNHVVQPLVRQA
jgi:DNA-binding Lrp family transcriptional regulator